LALKHLYISFVANFGEYNNVGLIFLDRVLDVVKSQGSRALGPTNVEVEDVRVVGHVEKKELTIRCLPQGRQSQENKCRALNVSLASCNARI
jgi:hypothetical protein